MTRPPAKQTSGAGAMKPELQLALAAHREGRLADAEVLYRKLLARTPKDAEVLQLLGLLCGQSGRLPEGIEHIEAALREAPALAQAHYNLASLRLKAGEAPAALEGFRRAGELAPDYAAAHFALASLLQKDGQRGDAVAAYRKGLSVAPDNVAAMNNLAGLLRQEGQLDAAEACLKEALRIAPNYAEGHYALGQLRGSRSDWAAAAEAYTRCLTLKPDWPPALYDLAAAHQHLGDFDGALASLEALLQQEPGDLRTLQAMALLLRRQGRLPEAGERLRQLLAQAPAHVTAIESLAELAAASGDAGELLQCHRELLALMPEDPERWRAFAGAIRLLQVEGYDPQLSELLLAALRREDLDHQDLAIPAVSLLKASSAMRPFCVTEPVVGEVLEPEALSAMSDPLLIAVLTRILIADAGTEAVLTRTRCQVLGFVLSASSRSLAGDVLPFALALAQQCHLNEYLYSESADERDQLGSLRQALAAEATSWSAWHGLGLAVLASYRHLRGCADLEALFSLARDDVAMADLLRYQLDEPQSEASIRTEIVSLGDISDGVSRAVREQYEENPYPRWESLHHLPARPLAKILPEICPALADVPPPPEHPRVLVAGCGTGRHALLAAQLYRASELVAVDLSRASLAYAIRKAEALGITGVTFYQADILSLPKQLQPFDVIESSGVLHHMAEPLAGWRALTELLKPGGVMKLALYSEAARQHIVAARELIAARGYPATADGIRQCRQEILARQDDPNMVKLAAGRDFYSLSLCRDLIFHVQEHRFTLPRIAAACDSLGLTFLGIEPQDPRQAEGYRARFPEDPRLSSLQNWATYESDNPDCFAEMYHFWLRKR